jgi:hypothetical protein
LECSNVVAPKVRPEKAQGEALGTGHTTTASPVGAAFRKRSKLFRNARPLSLPLVPRWIMTNRQTQLRLLEAVHEAGRDISGGEVRIFENL